MSAHNIIFASIAVLFSLFYGLSVHEIFRVTKLGVPISFRFHQFWLNFVGSLFGWGALWFVAKEVMSAIVSESIAFVSLKFCTLAFIAFIGITGFLPFTVNLLITRMHEVAEKLLGIKKD